VRASRSQARVSSITEPHAVATRRGSCSCTVDHAGCKWVVTLDSPERHDFSGRTLEEALAWGLVWLMTPELGNGPFLV
jgi:hypothetical protein